MKSSGNCYWRRTERGVTLVFVGLALTALLGVMALAIDLGLMYVARSEAQRAADSAALSGADAFLTTACTITGCVPGGAQETEATFRAEGVGNQNTILGQPVNVQAADINFTYPTPQEPQITVAVHTTVPTIFAKIIGIGSVNVGVLATAEAYNPTGSATQVSVGCLAPFLVPDCDPNPPDVATAPDGINPSCPGPSSTYFVNPNSPGNLEDTKWYPDGPLGAPWQLHFGSGPSSGAGPSQWYLIAFGGSQSGAQLRANIEQCSPNPINCGDTLQTMNGKKVGPVDQGVEALIHASGLGMNQGQDSIAVVSTAPTDPFQITIGFNNPDVALRGQTVFGGPSDSIVTVPIYNCTGCGPGSNQLPPGGTTVTVVGHMQLFIQDVEHNGPDNPVNTIIMGLTGCDTPPGPPPPTVSSGGAFIPIRLIQHPN